MIVHDVVQRSPEWYALRLGRLTSTGADAILATRKDKTEAAGRRNLRVRLVLERLTGRSNEREFHNQAMQDGIDREEDALAAYEAVCGKLIRPVGFVSHDTLMAGCSPDGIIGEFETYIEAKSPIPATHLDYLETGIIPLEYYRQILHGVWITGCQRAVFVSYCPEFPEPANLKIVNVPINDGHIAEYAVEARRFISEVDQKVGSLRTMLNLRETLEASAGVA